MADEELNPNAEAEHPRKRGMFDGFSGYATPTKEDWRGVLSDGMLVVDTNVLLNLYRYNQGAREALLSTLRQFDARLWVPHQVMDEFWRNRENALEDPEKQLRQSVTALRSGLERTFSDLRHWINRVSLGNEGAAELESILSDALDSVIDKMGSVVEASAVEMERDTEKDKIVSVLSVLLDGKVGANLTPEEYAVALREGKRRIVERIPPGYEDRKKQTRGDDTEIGDYLVWLQLMKEASSRGKDVLLVTGDAKEDWWRTRNKIGLGPRNELSEELLREANVRLYMLKPDRLLTYARDFLHVEVSEDSVQNVEMVEAQLGSDDEFERLKALAESNATAAVLGAWRLVELAMNRVLPHEYQSDTRRSVAQSLNTLTDLQIMTVDIARSALDLNALRNRIARSMEPEIATDGALDFVFAAKGIVDNLNPSSVAHIASERYERAVFEALVFHDFAVHLTQGEIDPGYDFLVRAVGEDSVIAVIVKFGRGAYRGYQLREELVRLSASSESVVPVLIVTNYPLSVEVRKFNYENRSSGSTGGRRVQVVQWVSPADNPRLVDAIDTVARRD